ncbi:MAG: DUF4445 domain-containing protein, partial [Planctomycetes bacterium]|nr:DUF4445 domain-containing protein [Planctomycetota bacterium]
GRADTPPTTLLRREEIQRNYLLACESRVLSDLQILIPEESRLEGGKILLDEDAHRFGTLAAEGDESQFKLDPLVKKVFLDLHSPSVDENLADKEQVFYAIHTKVGVPLDQMQMGYRILRQLPQTLRESQWQVTATVAHRGSTAEVVEIEKGDRSRYNLGVAVDVGTTTVVAHLIDLGNGKTIDAEATYNAQMKYGEDYIQRIMYATENDALDVMQKSITDDVNGLIAKLVQRNHLALNDVTSVVCSGNTAMMHFLLGLDPSRIRREPYVPTANFIPAIRAAEAGITISGRGLLYCLPSVAAYVGSDITAGAVAIRLDKAEEMSLFIDIGTNGEVVLGHKDWMVCCSASAGPAFEGSGVRHGMRAAGGAIEKLVITKDLDVEYKTIGDKRARGVCGSGLLDCIAWLFRRGVIDRAGKFQRDVKTSRLRQTDEGLEFVLVKRADAGIDSDIVITQADIANLIRSKAAIYAAASILIESMHVPMDSIQKVYMAGAFGN